MPHPALHDQQLTRPRPAPSSPAGTPEAPAALAVSSWLNDSGVTLHFDPAWLAERGYQIEVLSQDGATVLDTIVLGAEQTGTCAAKAPVPQ